MLLTGLFIPAPAAPPEPPTKLLRASIGAFYAKGNTSVERTVWSVSYPTQLHLGVLPDAPRLYIDSSRRKTVVPVTSATNTVTVTSLEGLGLSWNRPYGEASRTYTVTGIGLYRYRNVVNGAAKTGISVGGKLGLGYSIKDAFIEADYTLVSRIKGTDPSGLAFRFGVQF